MGMLDKRRFEKLKINVDGKTYDVDVFVISVTSEQISMVITVRDKTYKIDIVEVDVKHQLRG